jgi:Uma2 family endonuclease
VTNRSTGGRMLAHATADSVEENLDMRMATETRSWTIEDLDRLPDDGNRYEIVYGELFVTPGPGPRHEALVEELSAILREYVARERVGRVFHRASIRIRGSAVEPDLTVRPVAAPPPPERWEDAPLPILVVEVLSATTQRRDQGPKRELYLEIEMPEYWIVDGRAREIRVVRATGDTIEKSRVEWHPAGASAPLSIDVQQYFESALGKIRSE